MKIIAKKIYRENMRENEGIVKKIKKAPFYKIMKNGAESTNIKSI